MSLYCLGGALHEGEYGQSMGLAGLMMPDDNPEKPNEKL
jgi:hypothetical protein